MLKRNRFVRMSKPKMSYDLGKSEYFINLLERLYGNSEYINNLNEIKKRMRQVRDYTNPQFDDIEAEIVCLILMHINPKKILIYFTSILI